MAQVPSESSKDGAKTSSADEISSPKTSSDLVVPTTLPTRGGWVQPLVLYQNYWQLSGRLQDIIAVKDHYMPRSDDILLATYPKCGTTWLKALAFAITTRSRHTTLDRHPLLTRHPQELVPHLELPTLAGDLVDIEKLPSPRLLATHLPLSLLPPAVSTTCRVVYLCRQPKDMFVSQWHFGKGIRGGRTTSPVELDDALGAFCEGVTPFGPVWEHYLEYWKEKQARAEQVLYMRYEEMVADPVRAVNTLASFLAAPFTEEEERRGDPEEIVRLCSFEMLSGLETNRTGDLECGHNTVVGKSTFFRKGKVGDWENLMTKEMAKKVDDVFQEKLKGSGLVF